jgi:hypothetical protein
MQESRKSGSVRGARDETHVPTATPFFLRCDDGRSWPIAVPTLPGRRGRFRGYCGHRIFARLARPAPSERMVHFDCPNRD